MQQLCLTRKEMAELARSPQRRRQIEFLRRNGIPHYIDAHGWPVVQRSAIGESASPVATAPRPWRSNKVQAA